jgi:outer membrane murein-binding lipoprotein Lpp
MKAKFVKISSPLLSAALLTALLLSGCGKKDAAATAQAQLQASEADRISAPSDVKLQQVQFKRTKALVKEGAQAQHSSILLRIIWRQRSPN